jgi:histidinol-phosphatase (PHP family)
MVKANYHTHHELCNHAHGTTEDYVKEAIKQGFTDLGMSDHVPSVMNLDGMRMRFNDLPKYYKDVRETALEYKDKINVHLGMECEYLEPDPEYYQNFLNEVDYLILGQHYIVQDGRYISTFGLFKPEHIKTYAEAVKKALESGYFSLFAHPDIFMCGYDTFDEAAVEAAHIIAKASLETGVPLEFNANGIRRGIKQTSQGKRYAYPRKEFWDIIRNYDVKIILSADAHHPSLLYDDAMKDAENKISEWRLKTEEYLTFKKFK